MPPTRIIVAIPLSYSEVPSVFSMPANTSVKDALRGVADKLAKVRDAENPTFELYDCDICNFHGGILRDDNADIYSITMQDLDHIYT